MKNKWEESLAALSVGQQFAYKVKDDARKDKIRRYAPLILLVIMTMIGAVSQKDFFTWGNVVNIMYQMSIPLVISVGLTYVLLLGSIDLSIEGVMGFAGSFVAFLVVNNSNSNDFGILGILFVILISTFIGAITGIIHVKARIATFIVTYAVGSIMTGVAVLVYQGTPIQVKDELFVVLSQGKFIGIPYITIIAFAIFQSRIPPAAFTATFPSTVSIINLTSSIVAPPVPKPVLVLMKSGFTSLAIKANCFISSLVK